MLNLLASSVSLLPFYLMGCFPTGFLVARLHGVDITSQGSGNVGATNVGRVIGKKAGVLTLVGDVIKGALAVAIAYLLAPYGWFPAGAAAAVTCGHCFSLPPWLKGGKGVATALGTLLVIFPAGALVAALTFGAVFWASKIVSIASITSALVVPIFALLTNQTEPVCISLAVMAAVIVGRHRENITRIIEGREPRFSARK